MDYQMTLPKGGSITLEESKPEDSGKNRMRMYTFYEGVRSAGRRKPDGADEEKIS